MKVSLTRSCRRLAAAASLALVPAAAALAAPPELTLERIFADPPLTGHAPPELALSPDGQVLASLRASDADSEVLDLWVQRLPDGDAGRAVATSDLLQSSEQKLSEAERMALERKRINKRGITSFVWCAKGSEALLLPFSGDLYLARLGSEGTSAKVVRLTHDDDVPELAPKCSPRGSLVSYTKRGDLYVLDLAGGKERRLTHDGSPTHTYGLAEFIAAEEMDRHEGHWWSPDEKRLLAFEVDDSGVAIKLRSKIYADRTELFEQRYPAAGAANAKVGALVFDVASGKRTTLKTPSEDGYLPRAGFFWDSVAWVQWQSRDQRRLVLLEEEPDAKGGALRTLLEERDDAWVELHDDLRPLRDADRFLWSSERGGLRQLEIVERRSGARTTLTAAPEPVQGLAGVDETRGLAYYHVFAKRGREVHLHAVPLAGGPARPILDAPGWHVVELSRAGNRFIDMHSRWGRPPTVSLGEPGGAVTVLDPNPTPDLDAQPQPTPEWRDFFADDKTPLNGLLLPPIGRKAGQRYPVVMWVYGGPTRQVVADRWVKVYPLFVYLTQRGYGVMMVDNRGTGGRGHDLDRAHYHKLGDIEIADIFGAVEQAKAIDWIDPRRIAIWGWSYGGYLAARAVLDDETPFAAAVAIAPVSDWTLYDTHYTERYLGKPDGGRADPYVRSNLLTRAGSLARPLLIAHGTADDNVLFEHSLRLVEALQTAGKPFELMIYPGKAHGIAGSAAQRHVYATSIDFFDRRLR